MEQAVGSSRRCRQRNAAERASSGAILHQPPQGVFKEASEGTALKWQASVLKLVCGCKNFVFIGARKLLQFSLGFVSFVVLFLFFRFGKG